MTRSFHEIESPFEPGRFKHRLFSHITMNWRGRPLTSHEVIVNSVAATTTRTGLTVNADLDTGTYPTGVRVGDRQMDALPLDRHAWHGDWNYTLRPEPYAEINEAPDPFDRPSPDLAWLRHPAFTGLDPAEWDTLITRLLTLHDTQREGQLDQRRGHRPRVKGDGTTGRRPVLTLAVLLHQRLGLPQTVIARLYGVTPFTINRRIRDVRQLLQAAGHTIQPAENQLPDLDALHDLATSHGITTEIKATG